ncbi:cytochrome c oxidase accessory protein CcoG [Sphingobacterium rhinopitheci]|uniref:cytochrome c oxidase accessory protein CcoG n=1 Tax=Sphingobacterium rhinopitheci TaxID=2781960 RepID=UPI001F51A1F3|nr:cytochrome c oxidase accessory protein CcoG [Sphingobacterium rhinopitheci]MCI0920784.1 cytochrome c oxidase accessory protein CcoG [Sphingobacterium rhinopitheci]
METDVNSIDRVLPSKGKKREWVYAKKPSGNFYNLRQWVGYGLLLFLFGAPFLKIGGNPFLMFNIIERKFSIFGNIFFPQDLHIFVFGMLIILVGIVLFTAIFGRVWCGWTCPQTIFMELVFRRIEYWIEGDWTQQKKLNSGPNTDSRAIKKLLKHTIFLIISFFIANIFLAYIIGIDELFKVISDPIDQHTTGFIAIIIFTLLFYFVFAFVREIVCTTICPYGRFQGVLLDDQSLTVAYNEKRGEPRGKQRKDDDTPKGDCIDCGLCVHVCPTGIDIRNGIQLECVNCTACVDACDTVMDKIGKPKRLIGFYSLGQVEGKKDFKKSKTRHYIYAVVLVILTVGFVFMIFNRSLIGGSLLRATGSTYQMRDDGTVSNLYNLELLNKSGKDISFEIEPQSDNFKIQLVNSISNLEKDGAAKMSFFIIGNPKDVKKYKTDIKVLIKSDNKVIETLKTTFISPPGA